jgi:hypothetical protein
MTTDHVWSKLSSSSTLLERWHELIHTYTVNLIGDYAGNELFLLEGDSLLLHCFGDEAIDFKGMKASSLLLHFSRCTQ